MDKFTDEVLEAITSAPLDTRRRWYAALNSYELPADFPVQELEPPSGIKEHGRSEWTVAFRAVQDTLSDDESSWGWWKYHMERPFAEWLAWWHGRGLETSITEQTA